MKRSLRDMFWILSLAAIAFIGIRLLSHQIHSAQSIGESNPFALIMKSPQAVLCLQQPQTLQRMMPTLPAVQQLFQAYLPENPLCQPEQIGEWLPFTLIYYPEGEVWMATLTERAAIQLWKRLDDCHSFAAEEQTELTLPVRYYPERGKRFLGCYYHQGIFVASHNRQLLIETIKRQLRPRTADSALADLQTLASTAPTAPLLLLLPREHLFPTDTMHATSTAPTWLSLPLYFNEGNLCCLQEWPLPTTIPDSLLTTKWLQPLRDSLLLRLQPLLPGVETDLQATLDEQAAYFSFRAR